MMLQRLKISIRLFVGFGVAIASSGLLLAVALFSQSKAMQDVADATQQGKVLAAHTVALTNQLHKGAIYMRNMGLAAEPNEAFRLQREAEKFMKAYVEGIATLKNQLSDPKSLQLLTQIEEMEKRTRSQFVEAVGLMAALSTEEAVKLIAEGVDPKQRQSEALLESLSTQVTSVVESRIRQADETASQVARSVVGFGVLCMASLCLFGWRIARSILVPLGHACSSVERIAAGDLVSEVPRTGADEMTVLLQGIDHMRQELATMVNSVRNSAHMVAQATSEIASGNSDLSHRTEMQASALQQAAATMDELDAALRATAESAAQASEQARASRDRAQDGGTVVREAVSTMRSIQESSRQIAHFTSVIDGIAFQTNILSLNAAVEAARAGEQGRGFAVVAAEVRTLAQRSADAAKEIKSLIDTSVSRIDTGTQLVERAGSNMDEIVASIRQVSEFAQTIRTATEQQSTGVSQVGGSIKSLDDMTQQTAAMVEQNSAAASSLHEQTSRLLESAAAFKLAEDERAASLALTAPRPTVLLTQA